MNCISIISTLGQEHTWQDFVGASYFFMPGGWMSRVALSGDVATPCSSSYPFRRRLVLVVAKNSKSTDVIDPQWGSKTLYSRRLQLFAVRLLAQSPSANLLSILVSSGFSWIQPVSWTKESRRASINNDGYTLFP